MSHIYNYWTCDCYDPNSSLSLLLCGPGCLTLLTQTHQWKYLIAILKVADCTSVFIDLYLSNTISKVYFLLSFLDLCLNKNFRWRPRNSDSVDTATCKTYHYQCDIFLFLKFQHSCLEDDDIVTVHVSQISLNLAIRVQSINVLC